MKGYIYKLYCKDEPNVIYIGSTKSTLNRRFSQHKANFNSFKKGVLKKYTTSFSLIERGECIIDLLEEIEYEDIKELRMKEREYIERLDCINKHIPCITREEYLQRRKKEWEDKKEIYNRKRRDMYHNDPEYKRKIQYSRKKYEFENKDRIKETRKMRREELKSKGIDPDAKAKQRVICPNCNKEMCYAHLRKRHYKICPALTN